MKLNFKKSFLVLLMLGSLSCFFLPAGSQAAETVEKPVAAGQYPAFGFAEKRGELVQGEKVYKTYCAGCHGVEGDGNGPAASFLNPKPRNFKKAQFRFSSRPSGQLPTDEDLVKTVTDGLTGTSMPSWHLVPEADRRAVVAYIKTFAPDIWARPSSVGPTIITNDPYMNQDPQKAIERGRTVYHGMAQCYSCHAAYLNPKEINEARAFYKMPPLKAFRKNLPHPQELTTSDGYKIIPPDFVWDKMKRGTDLRTLYHVIGNGINGTPMPTWKGIFAEEDLWALVYYVQSLSQQRKSLVTEEDIRNYRQSLADRDAEQVRFEAEQKKLDEAKKAQEAAEKEKASADANAASSAVTSAKPQTEGKVSV